LFFLSGCNLQSGEGGSIAINGFREIDPVIPDSKDTASRHKSKQIPGADRLTSGDIVLFFP
jgi:hypothetical protein